MSKEVYEWDEVAAANSFPAADGGGPEGQQRKTVNDALREHIASERRQYNDPEWIVVRIQGPLDPGDIGTFAWVSDTQFTISLSGVDLSGYFTDGRIIKVVDGASPGMDVITQVAGDAVYSGGTLTTVNIKSTDKIVAGASDALVYHSSIARGLSLLDAETDFYIPTTADSDGINQAISDADAAGGGIVLLIHPLYTIDSVIDLDTKGNIILQGAGPRTSLEQTPGTNLDKMIALSNGSKINSLRDFTISVDRVFNPTGLGYAIEVDGQLQARIDRVLFINAETSIRITSALLPNLVITGCSFSGFLQYAIASSSATDNHRGEIKGCFFSGGSVTGVDPASIKVAGPWYIGGNNITSVGHASLVPRGIWLWNKTASENGGYQSRVIGNRIDGSLAANGIGIEVGASECTVSGNVVEMSSTLGTGIFVISRTGGQFVEHVAVTGNTITGGAAGISANNLVRHSTITGNTIGPAATGIGIQDAGDFDLVADNIVDGGATGIKVTADANNSVVRGNTLTLPTAIAIEIEGVASRTLLQSNMCNCPGTGILISATALNTTVIDNEFAGAPTVDFDNNSPTTIAFGNLRGLQEARYFNLDVDNNAPEDELNVPNITGVKWPGDVAIGTYQIEYFVENIGGTGDNAGMRFYTGPDGDFATDTEIYDTGLVPNQGGNHYRPDQSLEPAIGALENQLRFTVTEATDVFTASVWCNTNQNINNFVINYIWITRVGGI